MSHDEHFLERLERLDGPQAELALYHDSSLRSGPWTPNEAIVLIEPRCKHQHPFGVTSVDTSKPARKGAAARGRRSAGERKGEGGVRSVRRDDFSKPRPSHRLGAPDLE